ncbi:MAG TPA: hypothetical protein VIC33_03285 [Vicinamibacterales bacterium]|jgi:hypothetical protein
MASTGSNSSAPAAESVGDAHLALPVERGPGAAAPELVIGIGAYNNAATIGAIGGAVRESLRGSLAGLSSRVVLAEGGSNDGTPDLMREALGPDARLTQVSYPVHPMDLLQEVYHGLPGRAHARAAIFRTAHELGAAACVILDATASNLAPEWIARLAQPVLENSFDLVVPYYLRPPHEGALTRSILYPLFRSLYGVRIRQPLAADFACSSRLVDSFLALDHWPDEAGGAVDLWTTTTAVAGGYRVCEAALGTRRHEARDNTPDLSTVIVQVVGPAFGDLQQRAELWQRVRGSASVPVFGEAPSDGPGEPIDVARLVESFRLGYRELRDVWAAVLPPSAIIALKRLVASPDSSMQMDDELWARIVFDFAVGYRLRVLRSDHLLQSLAPLYLGWVASFLQQVRDATPQAVDERVDRLGAAFERQKPYLISRWRWPERFSS